MEHLCALCPYKAGYAYKLLHFVVQAMRRSGRAELLTKLGACSRQCHPTYLHRHVVQEKVSAHRLASVAF